MAMTTGNLTLRSIMIPNGNSTFLAPNNPDKEEVMSDYKMDRLLDKIADLTDAVKEIKAQLEIVVDYLDEQLEVMSAGEEDEAA